MLTSQQTLDMTPIGMIFHVAKTADEPNSQSLEMEWELLGKSRWHAGTFLTLQQVKHTKY